MSALRNLEPGAVLALVGATVLMAVGLLPGETQHRHERACMAAVALGLALVALGAGLWLGGGR